MFARFIRSWPSIIVLIVVLASLLGWATASGASAPTQSAAPQAQEEDYSGTYTGKTSAGGDVIVYVNTIPTQIGGDVIVNAGGDSINYHVYCWGIASPGVWKPSHLSAINYVGFAAALNSGDTIPMTGYSWETEWGARWMYYTINPNYPNNPCNTGFMDVFGTRDFKVQGTLLPPRQMSLTYFVREYDVTVIPHVLINSYSETVLLTRKAGKLQFSLASYTANENSGQIEIMVKRVDGAEGEIAVDYATSDGTATAGADYVAASGTLTFTHHQGAATFVVPLINDSILEGGETVNLTLSNPTHEAELGDPASAVLTIADIVDVGPTDAPQLGTVVFQNGVYSLPVTSVIKNFGGGTEPARNILVQFSVGGRVLTEQTIAQLAVGASATLNPRLNINAALTPGNGQDNLKVTVAVDPRNTIPEANENNNTASATIAVDVRPRLTNVRAGFRPGTFLAGVDVENNFDVWVDWNGALSGNGAVDEQKEAQYALNGFRVTEPVTDVASAPAATHTFNMGSDLRPGSNVLRLRAVNAAGFTSDDKTLLLTQVNNAAWLAALAVEVETDPPTGQYDKVAVYKMNFEWPNETIQGFFDVPADKVPILKKEYGPSLSAWALGAEFRSDDVGAILGSGSLEGEISGRKVLSAQGNVTVDARGEIGARADGKLHLKKLEGKARAEGAVTTPQVALTPYLPFIYVQGKIGAGVDATLGVEEQANGQLGWQNFVLGLDGVVEGTASCGSEGLAYAEGAIGGASRGEFQFPPSPLLKSLNIDLYARAKAQLLVWEKSWEAHYIYQVAGGSGLAGAQTVTLAAPMAVTAWHPAERFATDELALQAAGLPSITYPYAAPALARRSNGEMMLVYVFDSAAKANGQQLEIAAARWNGSSWTTPVSLTNNSLLDAQPTVAYDSGGRAIALWTQLKNAVGDPGATEPQTVMGDMEIAYAVYSPTLSAWGAPLTLTSNAQMDFLPQARADITGNVMALWLHDADNAFPLFTDDVTTTLGSDVYYATWNGSNWSAPAAAVSGANTNEAPQFARNGSQAFLAWSHDADGRTGTLTDTAIYLADWDGASWTTGSALAGAGDGVADLTPRLTYDSAGRAALVWVKSRVPLDAGPDDVADQLYFTQYISGTWTPITIAVQAQSIVEPALLAGSNNNLYALWQGRSAQGMDLWYAVYDRAGSQWSQPRQLTNDGDLEWAYNAYIDSANQLEAFSLNRAVMAAGSMIVPTFVTTTLVSDAHTIGRDLTVEAFTLSASSPVSNTAITLTAVVRNSGDLVITAPQAAFYDNGVLISPALTLTDLSAGQSVTVTFIYTAPASLSLRPLQARVDPNNHVAELNETNNQLSQSINQPNVYVEWVYYDTACACFQVSLRNNGPNTARNFSVVLRATDPVSGPIGATYRLSDIDYRYIVAGESYRLQLSLLSAQAVGQARLGWVVADVNNEMAESDETDNWALVALGALPDLTLNAADVQFSGSAFTITVRNDGLYTATDILLTARQDNLTGTLLYTGVIGALPCHRTQVITPTIAHQPGELFVQLDPDNLIEERDESNNLAVTTAGAAITERKIYLPLVLRQSP